MNKLPYYEFLAYLHEQDKGRWMAALDLCWITEERAGQDLGQLEGFGSTPEEAVLALAEFLRTVRANCTVAVIEAHNDRAYLTFKVRGTEKITYRPHLTDWNRGGGPTMFTEKAEV